ncbi:sialidase family protein [Priestia filamentosa]|uniref:WD40/YVTN/BNR-like repeat-containing protein n=1 Tax=Priestia filamentosa TaxID=1402861 RepID=UPI00397AA094
MIKSKKWLIAITTCIFLLAIGLFLFLKLSEPDFNKDLPMSISIDHATKELGAEDAAYMFLSDLLDPYKELEAPSWKKLDDVRFDEFQLLAGDNEEAAVAVTFWIKPKNKTWSIFHNWGNVEKDGTIRDIHWTMRLKKRGDNTYELTKIEETSGAVAGLPPVEKQYQKEAGIKVENREMNYTLEKDKLQVTYNGGKSWVKVPLEVDQLFKGDYSGSKDTLIDGSFVISPEKTAFVFVEDGMEAEQVSILYSNNKGKTWKTSRISEEFASVRLRTIGFTSKKDGYLILTYDRTMGFEAHTVFKTNDGGATWKKAGSVPDVSNHVTDGTFINDKLGFLSFGTKNELNKEGSPYLFRTGDGGKTWSEVELPMPPEYQGIFVVAEPPTFDGSQGTLLVNQGPSGDYQGGNVLARFISIDKGKTWSFANLVDPDQVLDSEKSRLSSEEK